MFILFASFVAFVAGLAYIVSFLLTSSPSGDAAPLTREQVKALLSNVDFMDALTGPDPMFPTLTAEELLEIDRQEEGFELASAGYIPFYLVMAEDEDMLVFRPARLSAEAEPNYMSVHKSWMDGTPKTFDDCYWFQPDVNYAVSVENTYPSLFKTASQDWLGGDFTVVDMPSNDTTKCLTCLQHHHKVGDCFCSSKCESAFGAPRELVMEF